MPTKHKVLIVVLISTIFGLFSGAVGAIVARVYILEEAFDVPLFGDISFKDQQRGSDIVIHNAKKVIVEQNIKIEEAIRTSKESLVWFYKKPIKNNFKVNDEAMVFDQEMQYRIGEHLAKGFILTSDGWVVSEFIPKDIAAIFEGLPATSSKLALEEALKEYVVISDNEDKYDITGVVIDSLSGFVYWKIEANDLPVKKFSLLSEINPGHIAFAVNNDDNIFLTTISGIKTDKTIVRSSDEFDRELVLNENIQEDFFSSFLFDISGNFLGIINKTGQVKPVSAFVSCINCLLENGEVSHPSLGVFYIDLAKYFYTDEKTKKIGALITKNDKGIAVVKGSAAELAGLKEWDIIFNVNGQEIDKDNGLASVISNHKVGDELNIMFLRDAKEMQLDLILGKKK